MDLPNDEQTDPPTGVSPNMPADEYHDDDGVGSTTLRDFDTKSLRHAEQTVEQTDAMRTGHLAHTAILEPDRWESEYLAAQMPVEFSNWRHEKAAKLSADGATVEEVADACNCGTDKVTEYLKRDDVCRAIRHFNEHDSDKAPDADTARKCNAMRDAAWEYLEAGNHEALLEDAENEISYFWEDPQTGERCKARVDNQCEVGSDGLIITDLKTQSQLATPHKFRRNVGRRGYHIQTGHYACGVEHVTGREIKAWFWLVVESKPPYGVRLFQLDPDDLQKAKSAAEEALSGYVTERDSDGYDGYSTEIETITVPDWA